MFFLRLINVAIIKMNNLFLSETVSPLSQFEIREILSLKLTIQNSFFLYIDLTTIGLYLTISLIFILVMSILSKNFNKIVSNNWSISQEMTFATILNVVINQINGKEGQKYFPFIFTLFMFILINNLMGLVKGAYV
jgi:F-type H+-transporting ATPase subunit a